jgi:site-specific recombinase XerC
VPHDTADLLKQVMRLHQQAMAEEPGLRRWKHLRDAALMGVLYSRAPRVSDLAAMRIGKHFLLQRDGSFLVHFPGSITKTHRKLEYPLDPEVARVLHDYLTLGRPHLLGSEATDSLWMGLTGHPLNAIGVTGVVRRRNGDFLDRSEGPHLARKWLTDTARSRSPEAAFDAAEVCGHSLATALKSYADAQDVHAGKRHGENLTRLRRQTEGLAERAFAERDVTGKEHQE